MTIIIWYQLKKIKGLSTKGKKSFWFRDLEKILLNNKNSRSLKSRFTFREGENIAVIRPKLSKISEKKSKKEQVTLNRNTEETWRVGKIMNKTKKTAEIQKWRIVKKLLEKEFLIKNKENISSSSKNKRYKLNMLKDITNQIKYKPDRYSISIASEELQSYFSNLNTDI